MQMMDTKWLADLEDCLFSIHCVSLRMLHTEIHADGLVGTNIRIAGQNQRDYLEMDLSVGSKLQRAGIAAAMTTQPLPPGAVTSFCKYHVI